MEQDQAVPDESVKIDFNGFPSHKVGRNAIPRKSIDGNNIVFYRFSFILHREAAVTDYYPDAALAFIEIRKPSTRNPLVIRIYLIIRDIITFIGIGRRRP